MTGQGASVKAEAEDPYSEFQRIFSKFSSAERVTGAEPDSEDEEDGDAAARDGEGAAVKDEAATRKAGGEDDDSEEEDGEGQGSKRKKRLEARMKIAALKQVCPRPDVVEVWDVTSTDPKLLVWLKSYRNTVPVPRHWAQKRKYLQGKRGIEKPAFMLPAFIEATGISDMRSAYAEKEEGKKLKQKQRDKMTGRTGKLDIDYQVLHDAFFKYQTKPELTPLGDLYYEGKEFEAMVKNAKPGVMSEALQGALGMAPAAPPPWLINMQRYGPPPSYPDLKVSGLNAPIPPSAEFGYQAGGWGKPPVDEQGIPLYGDVFGEAAEEESDDEEVDKVTRWGDLESDEEEESEEEEEEEEEEDVEEVGDGTQSQVSGYGSSLPSGIETPDVLDLRKAKAGEKQQLYTVLEQQAVGVGAGLMGSDHTYVLPGQPAAAGARRPALDARKRLDALRAGAPPDVEVAIDPEELEGLTEQEMEELYNERLASAKAGAAGGREDFSDMVAAKAAQQKRKATQQKDGKAAKKAKDSYKF